MFDRPGVEAAIGAVDPIVAEVIRLREANAKLEKENAWYRERVEKALVSCEGHQAELLDLKKK